MILLSLALALTTPDGGTHLDLSKCRITADDGDRIIKGADLVIAAGERVKNAIALEGNVVIKAGAKVHDAIALNGSLIVEDGAQVTGNAVAIGGKLNISPKAKVSGSRVILDDRSIDVVSDDGTHVGVALSIGGHSLAGVLLKPVLAQLHDCAIDLEQ